MPEIRRSPMANTVLCLKAYGVDDIIGFDFMDRPPRESLVQALEHLYALDALDDKGHLTSIGEQMAELPLDPVFSKVLLASKVRSLILKKMC
jgi:pre-mRNA-splicing factor ATP-dependent RNA helicase DHX16